LRELSARPLLLLAFLLLAPLPARADAWFSETQLQVPGNPKTVLPCDLDGDGLVDVAAVYAVSHAERLRYYVHLAAFLQGAAGYSTTPDATVPLSRGESLAFLGNTDASRAGPELLTLREGGISSWEVHREAGGAHWVEKDLGGVESRWIGADWSGLKNVDLARDLDGDGLDEILVPERGTLAILASAGDGRYTLRDRLVADVFREVGQPEDPGHVIDFIDRYEIKVSETFPEIYDTDVDADGRRDLLLIYADLVATYRQLPDGRFEISPRLFRSGITPNRDLLRSVVPPKIVVTQAHDFDGDARADLIVSRAEVRGLKGILTLDFHRNIDGSFEKEPSFHLRQEVLALWPMVADYDQDGKLDFTFLQTDFGIREIINFLLTRRLTFHFEFYPWRGAPAFPEKPIRRKDVSVKFDLKEGHLSAVPLVDISHDFNGDGLPDFYSPREREAFSVYFARRKGDKRLFSGSPDIHVRVHQSFYRRFVDLNRDGRADVIFWYQAEVLRRDLNDKILVLTSNPIASP
jgi:hypothetical protein